MRLNPSDILFNFSCPSSVLLSASLRETNAPTIAARVNIIGFAKNALNVLSKPCNPLPTAPIGPGASANASLNSNERFCVSSNLS